MEHTPTPWRVGSESKDIVFLVGDESERTLGPAENWIDCNTEANARRIVACVNACDGVPTETLEFWSSEECAEISPDGKRQPIDVQIQFGLTHAVRLLCQRDQLAEALRKIINMNRQHAADQYGDPEKAEAWACITTARAALAAIGEQQ